LRILQIEMDEAGHVIPTAEIEAEDVSAKVPGELFHLESKRMRLDERHALDGVRGEAFHARDHLEQVTPPKGFVGGLRFRDIKAQRVLEGGEIDLISN